MTNNYNSSRSDLLKRIGLSPSKKLMVFLVSAVLVTIPFGYAYNSVCIILFVLYSFLSARQKDFSFSTSLLLPMLLFTLMVLSLTWSIDFQSSIRALSKEAALFFIPLAFFFNKQLIRMGVRKILKNLSVGMCFFGVYFLGRAVFRYLQTDDTDVFLSAELSTCVITPVYLSALFSMALFYFLSVKNKKFLDYAGFVFVACIIGLLLNKVIIITDVILAVAYILFYSKLSKSLKIVSGIAFITLTALFAYYARTKGAFPAEYISNTPEIQALAVEGLPLHNVTLKEAWSKPVFSENDYFNGTAFRTYQVRIFAEMLEEDKVFFTGYGISASIDKIEEKAKEHNVFEGGVLNHRYSRQNFHNQYVEAFADLGIVGFILLLLILVLNFKNAILSKDFMHIAFAILMIALLLTESFLWRQRGVVFFTVFYCLFNGIPLQADKEKYEKNTNNRGGRFSGIAPL